MMRDDTTPWRDAVTRRELIERTVAAIGALTPWMLHCASDTHSNESAASQTGAGLQPAPVTAPLQVGMLLYPGFTLLDLAGPQLALALNTQTHLVWRDLEPVPSDSGIALQPTTTYAGCPLDLDVLFVPGGGGTADAMADTQALQFLIDRAHARYVTSVCTGALVLAAAGLLDGYRATTHWLTYEALSMFDVDVVRDERVVVDRNRLTGGGVTAGIDFGLTLIAQLRGEQTGRVQQLLMEYAPQPPFDSGTPAAAGDEVTALARGIMEPVNLRMLEAATVAAGRRG